MSLFLSGLKGIAAFRSPLYVDILSAIKSDAGCEMKYKYGFNLSRLQDRQFI